MINKFEFHIDITGQTRNNIADSLNVYFGQSSNIAIDDNGMAIYSFIDKYDREWCVKYSEHVRSDCNADDYKNVLVTPYLYIDSMEDVMMLHDVLLILKVQKCIINPSCGARIRVPYNVENMPVGLCFEEYVKRQEEQIKEFETSATYMQKTAKLYQYEVEGLEYDTVSDIVAYTFATYAPVLLNDESFAETYAINFLPCVFEDKLEFRAFNSTFDEKYFVKAANWIRLFMRECETIRDSGWLDEFIRLRNDPNVEIIDM